MTIGLTWPKKLVDKMVCHWAWPSITPGSVSSCNQPSTRTPPVPAPAPCQMVVTHTSPSSSLLTTLHHPAPLCHQHTSISPSILLS